MTKAENVPFQVLNKGKCNCCKEHKQLDGMVRVDYQKGLYECIDCKTDKEARLLKEYPFIMSLGDDEKVKGKTLKKFVGKLLG